MNYTEKMHVDSPSLKVALANVKAVADLINNSNRDWERLDKVIQIYEMIKPPQDVRGWNG